MEIDSKIREQIEELQVLERNLQNFLMQKQSIQVELNESENAEKEVSSSKGEIYKIVGGVMIQADKNKTLSELSERKKTLQLRISSLEKQEAIIEKKIISLREGINKSMENTSTDKNNKNN